MLKVYFKVFILMGAIFFFAFLIGNMISMVEVVTSLETAAIMAVLGGTLLSAIMGTIHIRNARKVAGGPRETDIYSLTQVRQVKAKLPYDRAFSMVEHYFKEVAGYTLTNADHIAGLLEASPASGPLPSPTVIFASIRKEGEDAAEITLTVKPLLPGAAIDFGRNLIIAEKADAYLRASLHG